MNKQTIRLNTGTSKQRPLSKPRKLDHVTIAKVRAEKQRLQEDQSELEEFAKKAGLRPQWKIIRPRVQSTKRGRTLAPGSVSFASGGNVYSVAFRDTGYRAPQSFKRRPFLYRSVTERPARGWNYVAPEKRGPAENTDLALDNDSLENDDALEIVDAIPVEIRARIAEVFNSGFVEEWWASPIESLANLSPLQLFSRGKKDAVIRELGRIEQGLPV